MYVIIGRLLMIRTESFDLECNVRDRYKGSLSAGEATEGAAAEAESCVYCREDTRLLHPLPSHSLDQMASYRLCLKNVPIELGCLT